MRAVAVAAMPQLTYGFQTRRVPVKVVHSLTVEVRRAIWQHRKRMHSWLAAVLICYPMHQIHPPAACLYYSHVMSVVRALRTQDPDTQFEHSQLMLAPLFPVSRGPIQTFRQQLLSVGFVLGDAWDQVFFRGRALNLLTTPIKEFAHNVREALRDTGARDLAQTRTCYQDMESFDLKTTAKLYREGGDGFLSEVVVLLTNGLWTQQRGYRAQLIDSPNCPSCGVEEDVEHVLWQCPLWNESRSMLPERCVLAGRESPSARLCGVCHLGYPEAVKKEWPAYQKGLATIISQYQKARLTKGARTGDFDVGGAPNQTGESSPEPDFLTELRDVSANSGEYLQLTAHVPRERDGRRWPYADAALQQLIRFMGTLRKPLEGSHQPRPSILELYFSFMQVNGGARFCSGLTELDGGGRLIVQIDKFTKAVRAWQTLVGVEPLLAEPKEKVSVATWAKPWGYPESPHLIRSVILPDWSEVRRAMVLWAEQNGSSSQDSRGWKLWEPGLAHSQNNASIGKLAPFSPLWSPSVRLTVKGSPHPYERERRNVCAFVKQLRTHPEAMVIIDNRPAWHAWRAKGIVTRRQLQQDRRYCALHVRRLESVVRHVRRVNEGLQAHIPSCVEMGARVTCMSCGLSSPTHGAIRWLAQPCQAVDPRINEACLKRLLQALASAQQLHHATAVMCR